MPEEGAKSVYTKTEADALLATNAAVTITHGATDAIADQADIATHAAATDAHVAELLAYLLKGADILHIPTNYGWTESKAQLGGTSQKVSYLNVYTGTTASGKGLLQASLLGFIAGDTSKGIGAINWGKKLYIIFVYGRITGDAEAIARVQFKLVATEGALGDKGIGIRADNLALTGESWGTELGEVDLGVTLTSNREKLLVIILDPSVPKIEWYVEGVLKGTQSTAAKIPSGISDDFTAVVSIVNGATGGYNASAYFMLPKILQVR